MSASGPLNLIKPMPASPMGVAMAQIVSWSSLKSMMKAKRLLIRLFHGFLGGLCLFYRVNYNAPEVPLTLTLGPDFVVLLERQVNDPAIMCAHRAGRERPVGFLDLVAQLARQLSQAQLTFGTIVFCVNYDGNIFSGLFADYLGYQELECVERLAPLADEQA